jgi:hypothetical protein
MQSLKTSINTVYYHLSISANRLPAFCPSAKFLAPNPHSVDVLTN